MSGVVSDADILWVLYRMAVTKHVEDAQLLPGETEGEYRKRAEKAGLVAVANFLCSDKIAEEPAP